MNPHTLKRDLTQYFDLGQALLLVYHPRIENLVWQLIFEIVVLGLDFSPTPILRILCSRGSATCHPSPPNIKPDFLSLSFRVQVSGFRVQGSWFRVQGLGFRVNPHTHAQDCLLFLPLGEALLVPEYRSPSLIRNRAPLGPYSRAMPWSLRRS